MHEDLIKSKLNLMTQLIKFAVRPVSLALGCGKKGREDRRPTSLISFWSMATSVDRCPHPLLVFGQWQVSTSTLIKLNIIW